MPLDLLLLSMNIKSPLIRKAICESKIEDTLELLLFSKCQGGRRREALNLHNEWLDTEIKMPKGAGSRFIGKESLLQSQWMFFFRENVTNIIFLLFYEKYFSLS